MDARNHRKVRLNPELIQLSASRSDDRAVKKKNLRVFIYKGSSGRSTVPIVPILDDFAVGRLSSSTRAREQRATTRRGGSTTMITTARRCLGRLALLAAATATPVDYAADHVVFAHILVSRDVEGDGERAAAVRRDVGGHWTPLGAVGVIIERDDHGQQAAYRREGPQFRNQFQGHFLI